MIYINDLIKNTWQPGDMATWRQKKEMTVSVDLKAKQLQNAKSLKIGSVIYISI